MATLQFMDVFSMVKGGGKPWFRWHPMVALVVAAMLYTGVFILGWSDIGGDQSVAMLYVLPVSLLAVSFGRRVGALAGFTATALLVAWVLIAGVSLSGLGWLARLIPLLLLGVLLGDAADRVQAGSAAERALFAARLRQREAAEINDSILQRLTVAKWALEAGDNERAVDLLSETMAAGQALVVDLLADAAADPKASPSSFLALHALRRATIAESLPSCRT